MNKPNAPKRPKYKPGRAVFEVSHQASHDAMGKGGEGWNIAVITRLTVKHSHVSPRGYVNYEFFEKKNTVGEHNLFPTFDHAADRAREVIDRPRKRPPAAWVRKRVDREKVEVADEALGIDRGDPAAGWDWEREDEF